MINEVENHDKPKYIAFYPSLRELKAAKPWEMEKFLLEMNKNGIEVSPPGEIPEEDAQSDGRTFLIDVKLTKGSDLRRWLRRHKKNTRILCYEDKRAYLEDDICMDVGEKDTDEIIDAVLEFAYPDDEGKGDHISRREELSGSESSDYSLEIESDGENRMPPIRSTKTDKTSKNSPRNRQKESTPTAPAERDKRLRVSHSHYSDGRFKNNTGWMMILLAFAVLVLAISYYAVMIPIRDKPQERSIPNQFAERIVELRSQHGQDEKLWRIVRSLKSHIEDEDPRQPAVLMLVSMADAAEKRENIAKKVAHSYSVRCSDAEPTLVSGREYAHMDHVKAKELIDEKIFDGFNNNSCAVVVSNFEQLPPASTTIFYQFCENDFAPFKKVAVIFTLEIAHGEWDTDNQFTKLKEGITPESKIWDGIVETYMYHSLDKRDTTGTMKVDMISGLMTRITPAVAWVGK